MDECDEICVAALAIIIVKEAAQSIQKKKERNAPRWWVRNIFTSESRRTFGDHNLIDEMRLNDHESFFNYTRMSPASFGKLLKLVGPLIQKTNTNYREPINPSTRLALTLRYLATGNSQRSLSYAFRVGRSTTCNIIAETLEAIYQCLHDVVLSLPTQQDWCSIAEGFNRRWNFPNCIGAIDGKHINIKAPPDSGSAYYNYKHFFSIILLAVCDYRYRFTLIDIGSQGRQSDGGVLKDSAIGKRLAANTLNVPLNSEIFAGGPVLPYYLLGDEAFGLKTNLITPFSGKSSGKLDYEKQIFNYRQSRARRVIENAFGILVARWRIFRTSLETSIDTTDQIVQAAVCLHNFCLVEEEGKAHHQKRYCPNNLVDQENLENNQFRLGDWRRYGGLPSISRQGRYNSNLTAIKVRAELAEHFMTDGSIPWQYGAV